MSISQIPPDSTLSGLIREVEAVLSGDAAPSSQRKGEASTTPSREATGDAERLGNYTNFVSASEYDDNRSHQHELRDTAAALLPGERVAACMRFIVPGKRGELRHDDERLRSSVHNVGVCGSVWTCPVCSGRVNYEKGQEIQRAIDHVHLFGGDVLLVTYTLQHSLKDRLAHLLDVEKAAWRQVQKGRPYQRFKETYGYLGPINAIEILDSAINGWHPHGHALLFFNRKLTDSEVNDIEEFLKRRWSDAVAQHGGYASAIYGLTVRRGESAAKYVTKWSKETNWDLSRELTSKSRKIGQGLSPFQLLDKFNAGDQRAGERFREYAEATKGLSQVRWGPGLRDKLLMDCELTDADLLVQSLERERANSRLVATFTSWQWSKIVGQGKIPELLSVSEMSGGDSHVVWDYLESIGVERVEDARCLEGGVYLDALGEELERPPAEKIRDALPRWAVDLGRKHPLPELRWAYQSSMFYSELVRGVEAMLHDGDEENDA